MMHDLFQNRYRIPSARATWHNYNGGIYFVTICTRGQEQYFGEISNSEMHLSEIGHYANEQIRNVQTHYPYAQIPLWVVMPNHLHAIVVIDGNNVPYERRGVGASYCQYAGMVVGGCGGNKIRRHQIRQPEQNPIFLAISFSRPYHSQNR